MIVNHNNTKIIVFCAGDRGKYALFTLRDRGYNVVAFCDNSKIKQGTVFHGLQVLAPEELELYPDSLVVVAIETKVMQESIIKQLKNMKRKSVSIGDVVYPDVINRIDAVYRTLLTDEKSRSVLYHYMKAHFEQDARHFEPAAEDRQYFCLDLLGKRPPEGEVFIDAGAYNGDTLEAFVNETNGIFERVISFEPTPQLFKLLTLNASRLSKDRNIPQSKFSMVFGGVGEFDCEMELIMKDSDPNGAGNSFYDIAERNGDMVPIYSIDSYLKGSKATYIKADIEGFELNMLKGAQKTITRYKPDLAICVYHKTGDIYEIPEYINSIVPEYKMYLRHHHHDYSETVLYCSIL
jgi:FkbM family methyltransferase